MPAFASVTLQNNAAADVVFTPSSIDANGVATWFAPGGTLDARPVLTLSVRNPKNGSKVARVTGKVVVPIMDTVDTSLKIGDAIGTVEFTLPKVASQTQRLDARKLMDTFISHAFITAAVQDIESPY